MPFGFFGPLKIREQGPVGFVALGFDVAGLQGCKDRAAGLREVKAIPEVTRLGERFLETGKVRGQFPG